MAHALGVLLLLVGSLSGYGLAQLGFTLMIMLRLACFWCHQQVAQKIFAPMARAEKWRQAIMALLPPFTVLVLLVVILASIVARRMRWRDIAYDIAGPEQLNVAWRRRFYKMGE
jgi:heme exporter protein D